MVLLGSVALGWCSLVLLRYKNTQYIYEALYTLVLTWMVRLGSAALGHDIDGAAWFCCAAKKYTIYNIYMKRYTHQC